MSLFNKVLASVGIGAAKVDTKLHKSTYTLNEDITGVVEIIGGSTEQQIDAIYLTLHTNFIREVDDKKINDQAVLHQYKLNEPFTIQAEEKRQIPFSFTLPSVVPVTTGNSRVWIQTGLDIKNAVDPKDKDFIEIQPTRLANGVLTAIQNMGFRLRKVDNEQAPSNLRRQTPIVQEFEFTPTNSTYRRYLDELEIVFLHQSPNSVEILVQVDRRARGLGGFLSEAFDMDESFIRLTLSETDNIQAKLEQVIKTKMK
ncbi:sporulation-control protein [Solibacillus kalamii]|uniref:Sporulation protein SpoOM n=1 Tax=Solibacillus kalamii TaxID=1748298 RepID=A0ABX3ZDV8_9BACL|nr:sporulation protein [Solibacillus kalamii]MBM7666702.1 sporulation-control protein [Solibacillus kalamii]OUZ37816.1 sporulation protein SpoOM [Solibacillus kalamii]